MLMVQLSPKGDTGSHLFTKLKAGLVVINHASHLYNHCMWGDNLSLTSRVFSGYLGFFPNQKSTHQASAHLNCLAGPILIAVCMS